MEVVKKYITQYYSKEIPLTADFEFQEAARIIRAKEQKTDALEIVRSMLPHSKISRVFTAVITRALERKDIKEIWTWPIRIRELPWIDLTEGKTGGITKTANHLLHSQQPEVALQNGKIYLLLNGFVELLWKKCP